MSRIKGLQEEDAYNYLPTYGCVLIILYVFTSLRILTKGLILFLAIQNDRMGNVIENTTEI
jgi:hypothetical protein